MRNNKWLEDRFNKMWVLLFPEIKRKNKVIVKFKGKWKNKFGHIKKIGGDTEIVINGFLKNEIIPEYIIDITIAHEVIHYMHGFNSPLKRQFKYPHKGGVVNRELLKRGFGHMLRLEREFIKKEWPKILREYF
jgi:hypothetical protein